MLGFSLLNIYFREGAKMKKRKIGVIVGSVTDLAECHDGAEVLEYHRAVMNSIEVAFFHIMSVHRNMNELFRFLGGRYRWLNKLLAFFGRSWMGDVDVLIVGAGWAAHLPGMCDARLRYILKNTQTVIVGVGFEDPANNIHTLAAKLSISEVPGTQVVHADNDGNFLGAEGFVRACRFAAAADLPKVTLPKPKPSQKRSFAETLEYIRRLTSMAEVKK